MGDFTCEISSALVEDALYTYSLNSAGEACIDQCKASCPFVRIPDTLDGHPVSAIGESAFSMLSHIEDVVCPCALRHIGRHAFEGCLRLRSISLNSGLQTIGEEAFFLCTSLGRLDVPASVEQFGPRPLGSSRSTAFRKSPAFEVRFDPAAERLFFDEQGVLYERCADGLVLVDGYRFEGDHLTCREDTVEIGPRALSCMPTLKQVTLPNGLRSIGNEAFRGSTNLKSVNLPASLERIGATAFSCTALEELSIPANCTDIHPSAFALGTVSDDGAAFAYTSHLAFIDVDERNPLFCMKGGVVCRRLDNGKLEALLAPARCERVTLGPEIELVRATTFAGTSHIDCLSISDGVAFETGHGRFAHCQVGRIELPRYNGQGGPTALPLPEGAEGRSIMAQGASTPLFDSLEFLHAYDDVVAAMSGGLQQVRLVIARLANPIGLDAVAQGRFRAFIENQLSAICVAFGQRGDFAMFEFLADAGILHEQNIAMASEALSSNGDAAAIGFLLDMKKRRFGDDSWDDYEL